MEKDLKVRMNFSLSQKNASFIKNLSMKTGFPMSLFLDSWLTGIRASMEDGLTEREAISMALEQIAKDLRK